MTCKLCNANHPGDVLGDELKSRGLSYSDLARAIKVPSNRISQIVNGKRSITADTALRLDRYLGVSFSIWLSLQTRYDINLALSLHGDEIDKIEPYNG